MDGGGEVTELRQKALDVMKHGGHEVCARAISKWWSGEYGTETKQQREMLSEWKEVRSLISAICSELRKDKAK